MRVIGKCSVLTYGHFFTESVYGYAHAHALLTNDRLQDIQLRTAFGVSVGYELYSSDDLNLAFEVEPDYVNTNFYQTPYLCLDKLTSNAQACNVIDDNSEMAARWFINYDQFVFFNSFILTKGFMIAISLSEVAQDFVCRFGIAFNLPMKYKSITTMAMQIRQTKTMLMCVIYSVLGMVGKAV